mmetsp:Transcript_1418/g.3431  ORF Transcript_1418/g.3431 Transcript_1418/m.3431 type:complete len:210 (-) Transcript_1418:227-856(-)
MTFSKVMRHLLAALAFSATSLLASSDSTVQRGAPQQSDGQRKDFLVARSMEAAHLGSESVPGHSRKADQLDMVVPESPPTENGDSDRERDESDPEEQEREQRIEAEVEERLKRKEEEKEKQEAKDEETESYSNFLLFGVLGLAALIRYICKALPEKENSAYCILQDASPTNTAAPKDIARPKRSKETVDAKLTSSDKSRRPPTGSLGSR